MIIHMGLESRWLFGLLHIPLLLVCESPGVDLGIAPFGQSCMTTQGVLHTKAFLQSLCLS